MEQDKEKGTPSDEEIMFSYADKFIALANELSQSELPGNIGVAMRYAAARYSAFEAALQTDDLAEEMEKHVQFFAQTFTEMLQRNFEEYIELQAKNKSD